MGAFIVYLLKSSLLLAMLVSLFMLFMSRETFHKLNRYLLLLIVVVSLALPFANVGVSTPLQGVFNFIENGGERAAETLPVADVLLVNENRGENQLPVHNMVAVAGELNATDIPVLEEKGSAQPVWLIVLLAIYGLGVVSLVIRQAVMYIQVSRLIMRSNKVSVWSYGLDGVKLRLHGGDEKPFSWFGWVVVSNKDMDEGACEILTHEAAHVRAGHSWDILLADAVIILQWFNPLAWIMKNTLKDIHEFEADEAVISSGVNAKQYQLLIIKKAVGARLYSIANSFNHSLTKKRITMMCKEKSSKWSRAKALYILPVAAVAAFSFSTVENANAEPTGKVNEIVADGTISGVENNAQVVEVDYIYDVAPAALNDDPEKIYEVVEVQPEFPGGTKEMMKYLQSNLKYPEDAKAVGAEGKAFVRFVVKADGSIGDVQIMRSTGNESLDDEALRVVKAMPKWRPAMNKGEAVNVKFVLPIVYKLPKEANGNGIYVPEQGKEKLLVVSGGAIYDGDINDIDPKTIESIEIVKFQDLTPELQEKLKQTGKEGVMYINFKKEKSASAVGNEAVFTVCEEMPEFPGGQQELMKYLRSNIKYPMEARDAEVMGKVFVRFVVSKEGRVVDASVLKGEYSKYVYNEEANSLKNHISQKQKELEKLSEDGASADIVRQCAVELSALNVSAYSSIVDGRSEVKVEANDAAVKALEAEALRVVGLMPVWNPGMQDGKPVNTQYVLPIVFRLS